MSGSALGGVSGQGEWRHAAQRVGEELAPNGPNGYYGFTAVEWRQWAMRQVGILRAGLKAGAERILELELENATLAAAVQAKEQDCVLLDAKLLECTKEIDREREMLRRPESAPRCGAKHIAPDAECELPKGHTENHLGPFLHGSVQWPSGGGI